MSVPPPDFRPQENTPTNAVKLHNTPQDTWILWPLLLPLILGAGVVLMQTTVLSPDSSDAPPERVHVKPIHTSAQTPMPQISPTPVVTIQYSIPTAMWVAGDDAKLHQKPFQSNLPANSGADISTIYTQWINAIIAAAPEMFPTGTHVQSVQLNSDAATVNFNAAFNDPNFWSGETKTKLAIYSIVNTLAPVISGKGRDVLVQFLVDGKRLQNLGEFDLNEPIPPDYSLNASATNVAQSSTTSPAPNAGSSLP